MECYDASAHVYYPQHQEYVGPNPQMAGKCSRCLEIIDQQLAVAGKRQMERGDAEVQARADQAAESRLAFQRLQEKRAGKRKWE
jgi:hypothetical protein